MILHICDTIFHKTENTVVSSESIYHLKHFLKDEFAYRNVP